MRNLELFFAPDTDELYVVINGLCGGKREHYLIGAAVSVGHALHLLSRKLPQSGAEIAIANFIIFSGRQIGQG